MLFQDKVDFLLVTTPSVTEGAKVIGIRRVVDDDGEVVKLSVDDDAVEGVAVVVIHGGRVDLVVLVDVLEDAAEGATVSQGRIL